MSGPGGAGQEPALLAVPRMAFSKALLAGRDKARPPLSRELCKGDGQPLREGLPVKMWDPPKKGLSYFLGCFKLKT